MTSSTESFLDGKAVLFPGDCLDVLEGFEPNSFDACVTDPPYGLEFMGKEWDAPWKYGMTEYGFTDTKGRRAGPSFSSSRNPMCKACRKHKRGSKNHKACQCAAPQFDDIDHRLRDMIAFQAWCHAWAQQVFRVLKPGGHALICGGTRTFGRMQVAIEDAGFEIRDTIMWLYGSGFPKSLDVSKAIDKAAGVEREVTPASRMICGTDLGAISQNLRCGVCCKPRASADPCRCPRDSGPATNEAMQWSGFGTALKPACEPIVLARKPLEGIDRCDPKRVVVRRAQQTVSQNVLKWGTGALNIDGCRVGADAIKTEGNPNMAGGRYGASAGETSERVGSTHAGRWPANVIHDGSEEVVVAFPELGVSSGGPSGRLGGGIYGDFAPMKRASEGGFGDSGSAARFFYTAKADADDRLGSKHPTVKPLDLMQYLVRLVTPPGGLVLDPFAGTGTTGEAAFREGMRAVLIEREEEYQNDIRRRMALVMAGPAERKRESTKTKPDKPFEAGSLFASLSEKDSPATDGSWPHSPLG